MTVRQVWRDTAGLFWNHPILWLPVFGADLLSFFLTKGQKQFAHFVIYRVMLDAPSVLSGTKRLAAPGDPSFHFLILKAAAIGALFEWSAHFIQIVLYTIAFFMIVAFVRNIQQGTELPFLSAIRFVRSKWYPIFGLSLRVLVFVALFATLIGSTLAVTITRRMLPKAYIAGYVFACAGFCIIAYLTAPIAMRRIAGVNADSLTPEQTRQGRIFSMLAVVASESLGYVLPYVANSIEREPLFHNAYVVTTLSAIGSLLTAAPFIVLFIALARIVDEGDVLLPTIN